MRNLVRDCNPSNLKRDTIERWLIDFLPKLKRTTTRTQKCRLILAVERMDFDNHDNAFLWQYCKFENALCYLFDVNKTILMDKTGTYDDKQKINGYHQMILNCYPSLRNKKINRWKIKKEEGDWQNKSDFVEISTGGEAMIVAENFDGLETAVRVHAFDPFLFTDEFDWRRITFKMHLSNDFPSAEKKDKSKTAISIPRHQNIIRHFANIELFHEADAQQEDCVGWITIMERASVNLRFLLKENRLCIDERNKIASGFFDGKNYLQKIGINHYDLKLDNVLMLDGIPRIIDFGLVYETTGNEGFRRMGYTRRGSKYRNNNALFAGTPGFCYQAQLNNGNGYNVTNIWYYFFCSWSTAWFLLYYPIDERGRQFIDNHIKANNGYYINDIRRKNIEIRRRVTKIIHIPLALTSPWFNDPLLTRSVQMSTLKQILTKCTSQNMHNLTENILDQKESKLCVPISVTILLRYAIERDLKFVDSYNSYSPENILSTLTMIVYPRSMAGLNLNPRVEEQKSQFNDIETLLKRLCQKTYLMESGWDIVRLLGEPNGEYGLPRESACRVEKFYLGPSFQLTRPVTVTAAIISHPDHKFRNGKPHYHQMTMDRIEKNEYVLQNNQLSYDLPVIRIPMRNAYFDEKSFKNGRVQYDLFKWYIFPQAYAITLIPKNSQSVTEINCASTSDRMKQLAISP